ncbi:hypothetical protein D9757_012246 [Collybiopsis confluens]|uniref:F-box domain-containing protein n=1 Tax=Collybiopsis confluens TaxID=2823264 RepID=A0A8H5LIH0_9AGAR|nr:hypothetical protein D9757_012246 [Collybiopsis confluens]
MSPSEPILCSNCQSNIDGLVAEATRGDPEYSEILQRNKTNAIPGTVRERSQMQALIDEANGTLEQCDRAIAELEEGLARLKKSRIELIRTKIAPRRSLLSPIRKLPHEVLGLVFVNLQGAGITFDGYSKMKLQGAVFGLTWVCASWRATALSQSQLWSSYRINFTAFNSPPPELPDFMKECLEVRGKNALINVSLFGISDYSTRNTAPLLELVFQSTARWIGAKISYTEPWQKKLSLLTDGTKFPLIESLNLDCYSSGIVTLPRILSPRFLLCMGRHEESCFYGGRNYYWVIDTTTDSVSLFGEIKCVEPSRRDETQAIGSEPTDSMSPSEPILCSKCQSNFDGLVAEATRGDPEDSEILRRNQTNAIPETVRERSQIQAVIDEANGTLEQCDRAIAELEEGLARLKKSRIDLIRTKIAPRRSLLSPIRKLPHEVLGLVFVYVHGPGIRFDGYSKAKLQGAVFGLTWVCASWRATALSQNSPPPGLPDFLKECLEVRGKNTLMEVSLLHISDHSTRHTSPLLEPMFQSTERWTRAEISYSEAWQKGPSFITDGTKFPLMESLDLDCYISDSYSSGVGDKLAVLRLIPYCPQLRHFAPSHLNSSYVWVGMKNLISLDVGYITGPLTQLLSQCPRLERLRLGGWVAGQTTGEADHAQYQYHHTKISHLSISGRRGLKMGWSTGLFLPALTHLVIKDMLYLDEPAGELVNLLVRSHCSLQSLSLDRNFGSLGTQAGMAKFWDIISSVSAPDISIVIVDN